MAIHCTGCGTELEPHCDKATCPDWRRCPNAECPWWIYDLVRGGRLSTDAKTLERLGDGA